MVGMVRRAIAVAVFLAGCSTTNPSKVGDVDMANAPDLLAVAMPDLSQASSTDLAGVDLFGVDLARAADMAKPAADMRSTDMAMCGGEGQVCCAGGGGPYCNADGLGNLTCYMSACTRCGALGQSCCGGNAQHVGGSCLGGTCASAASASAGHCT